jgi:two-component system response regulator LytT
MIKILVAEDEEPARKELIEAIGRSGIQHEIVAECDSARKIESYLLGNDSPDLLILDIELEDGNIFSFLNRHTITIPIIFITAYNQYAIEAFKQYSIGYVLKPLVEEELYSALKKFRDLYNHKNLYNALSSLMKKSENEKYLKRFAVGEGAKILVLTEDQVPLFSVQGKNLFVFDNNGEQYLYNDTMDSVCSNLDPDIFFRINRQHTININAIQRINPLPDYRMQVFLNIPTNEKLIVSFPKLHAFKKWLNLKK